MTVRGYIILVCNQPLRPLSLLFSAGWETRSGQGPLNCRSGVKHQTSMYEPGRKMSRLSWHLSPLPATV